MHTHTHTLSLCLCDGPYHAVIGNASQWQMVANTYKSRLGGIGVGGLLEGEPRTSDAAWALYRAWIVEGSQVLL